MIEKLDRLDKEFNCDRTDIGGKESYKDVCETNKEQWINDCNNSQKLYDDGGICRKSLDKMKKK